MLQRTRQCILVSLILPNCAVCSAPPHLTASGGFTKSRSFSSKVQFTVVQLCSCAVVQLCILNCDGFWQKTPLTGHKWPGWEKNRLELEIKLSFSLYFFLQQIIWIHEYVWTIYSFQFQRLTTSDPWSSSSSTVFPAVQNNHKSTLSIASLAAS